jgi:hypothetical protein
VAGEAAAKRDQLVLTASRTEIEAAFGEAAIDDGGVRADYSPATSCG